MFGRNIKTHIDLLHPTLNERVLQKQYAQKTQHDKHAMDRDISVGDNVFVRNFSLKGNKWIPGVVVKCTGPLSYRVKTATHGIVRRHQDQIRTSVHHYTDTPDNSLEIVPESEQQILPELPTPQDRAHGGSQTNSNCTIIDNETVDSRANQPNATNAATEGFSQGSAVAPSIRERVGRVVNQNQPYVTRSGRVSKPPDRY